MNKPLLEREIPDTVVVKWLCRIVLGLIVAIAIMGYEIHLANAHRIADIKLMMDTVHRQEARLTVVEQYIGGAAAREEGK